MVNTCTLFQAWKVARNSLILFCFLRAASRLSSSMFSNPMKTRLTPAAPDFSMKRGILWHMVSTCRNRLK